MGYDPGHTLDRRHLGLHRMIDFMTALSSNPWTTFWLGIIIMSVASSVSTCVIGIVAAITSRAPRP